MTVDGRDGSRRHLVEDMVFKQQNGSENGLGHFRVDQLLKTSTGLDIDDLVLRAKRRENGKKGPNRNQDHEEKVGYFPSHTSTLFCSGLIDINIYEFQISNVTSPTRMTPRHSRLLHNTRCSAVESNMAC